MLLQGHEKYNFMLSMSATSDISLGHQLDCLEVEPIWGRESPPPPPLPIGSAVVL